jgi:cyclomaltodextrinase
MLMAGLTLALLMTIPTTARAADRAHDWRYGPVVYQVFVDRFAPPANLEAKRAIIRPPRRLHPWSELPRPGVYDAKLGIWTHEIDFWGGDLASLSDKLDYIAKLGADVLYLTPVHRAFTNHKYDAQDYKTVSPEFGTRADLLALAAKVHGRGMRLMLDGVFNHMGKTSPMFQSARQDPGSRYRDWFYFGNEYRDGYRAWAGAGNLPALRLENPAVRDYLWNGRDSVVQGYLREGIDGWRLDVAFELGPAILSELTRAAHSARPDSVVVGEISGYPAGWFPAVDGVFNFYALTVAKEMLHGAISGGRAGRMLDHMAADAGIENLLRSWLLLDNHDTPRLADQLPAIAERRLAQALQFTLPGAPVIYYGSELGMTGSGDPQNRAPMRWDLVTDANPDLAWIRRLIALRRQHPALRYGDFTALDTETLLAFTRTTGQLRDTVLVAINPTDRPCKEAFATRVGRLMSWGELEDVLTGERIRTVEGMLTVEMPPRSVRIWTPIVAPTNGYSPYNRVP